MKRLKLMLGSLFALLCCLFFESGTQAMEHQSAEHKSYWYDATGKVRIPVIVTADSGLS